MVLDVQVSELIKKEGHDGSEIYWPELPDPLSRRGFHIQEMIRLCDDFGFHVTPFEPCPVAISADRDSPKQLPVDWGQDVLKIFTNSVGVLDGQTMNGSPHAVASEFGKIFDPGGRVGSVRDFKIRCFWRVGKQA